MDNLTYIRDSRNGMEAAVVEGIARFQMSIVGVVSRSDLQDGVWTDYRPIARSVRNRTEFHNYMICVAQHAAPGHIDNFTSEARVLIGDGIVMHTCVNGDRSRIGYQLSPEMNDLIPDDGRNGDGWYEQGEMSKVAAFLDHAFGEESVEAARRAVAQQFPEMAHHFIQPPAFMAR